jgi:hypothetical protein
MKQKNIRMKRGFRKGSVWETNTNVWLTDEYQCMFERRIPVYIWETNTSPCLRDEYQCMTDRRIPVYVWETNTNVRLRDEYQCMFERRIPVYDWQTNTSVCLRDEYQCMFLWNMVFVSQTAWRHILVDVSMLLMSSEVWVVYPTLQRSVSEYIQQKLTTSI